MTFGILPSGSSQVGRSPACKARALTHENATLREYGSTRLARRQLRVEPILRWQEGCSAALAKWIGDGRLESGDSFDSLRRLIVAPPSWFAIVQSLASRQCKRDG